MNGTTISDIRALAEAADERQLEALERSLKGDTRKGIAGILKKARSRIEACKAEERRLSSMYELQQELADARNAKCIVGLDEVGRGPLAGPLAVGAVVLPMQPMIEGLNDSKQVKDFDRASMADAIKETSLAWSIRYADPAEIDEVGIMAALRSAFKGAVSDIESQGIDVDIILLDGNPMHLDEREVNVVKGDSKCASIAAASIIAKVERDALMDEMDLKYPGYGFKSNKGYGTQAHRDAIRELGLTDIHRRSFCSEFFQDTLF